MRLHPSAAGMAQPGLPRQGGVGMDPGLSPCYPGPSRVPLTAEPTGQADNRAQFIQVWPRGTQSRVEVGGPEGGQTEVLPLAPHSLASVTLSAPGSLGALESAAWVCQAADCTQAPRPHWTPPERTQPSHPLPLKPRPDFHPICTPRAQNGVCNNWCSAHTCGVNQ